MTTSNHTQHRLQLTDAISVIVIVSCIALTFFAWHYTVTQQSNTAQAEFTEITNRTSTDLTNRLAKYSDALYSLRALFYNADDITNQQWQDFIANQQTFNIYPGIAAMAYIQQVEASQVDDFISSARADDSAGAEYAQNFSIFPELDESAGNYNIARFATTSPGRTPAVGFNLSSQPDRAAALQAATTDGTTKNSGPLKLVGTGNLGFQVYLPVYKPGFTPKDAADRQRLIEGHLTAVFNAQDLFDRLSGSIDRKVNLTITDESSGDTLYELNSDPSHRSAFRNTDIITVADHDLQLTYDSTTAFEADELSNLPAIITVTAGTAFTLLVIFMVQRRYRHHLRDNH